ncbi:hypothetical protein N9085_03325 [Akkermansiaceae bacterium]|nr:hypothetical protein [Akkermansiaceae bacterium]
MKSFSLLVLGLIIGCSLMLPTFAKSKKGKEEKLQPAIAFNTLKVFPD